MRLTALLAAPRLAMPGLAALFLAAATPASAETRFFSYDPADRLTRALTGGLTFQVDLGLFGRTTLRRIYSTSRTGYADVRSGGPAEVRRTLGPEAAETSVYAIRPEGQGRPLGRALCPGSDEAWLVFAPIRAARPVTARAVGRWSDGRFRECAQLSWTFRGEWSALPAAPMTEP
ncbi:hypothetical protein [Brevundimonas balnearis]|uniref:Tat pathway signal sequence domain protein n=1 Tax=Brevundimonas balnearis TaxID=1572858 RepID=A0ABV6R2P5_9CAUL